jgi:hypothetical protein
MDMKLNKRGLVSKRGLSDVVTTGLIILLAIAAVVIVWSFVQPALTDIGNKISTQCLTVDVKPTNCVAATGVVTVTNGPGDTTIDSLKLVYSDGSGNTEVIDGDASCVSIVPLGTIVCTPASVPTAPTSVAVSAVLGTSPNTETCAISTTTVACS